MRELKTYFTTMDDLETLEKLKIGERIKWIRDIANEKNPGLFTAYRLSEQTGISQSTIGRIESGKVQNPQIPKLQKIAEYLGVQMEVFLDDYYTRDLEGFVICQNIDGKLEMDVEQKPIGLMNVAYRIRLQADAESIFSDFNDIVLDKTVELTPLDYEEFIEDLTELVEKIEQRRLRWKTKQDAFDRLTEGRKNNE